LLVHFLIIHKNHKLCLDAYYHLQDDHKNNS